MKFLHFIERDGLLLCLQQPTTALQPQLDESIPYPHFVFYEDSFHA